MRLQKKLTINKKICKIEVRAMDYKAYDSKISSMLDKIGTEASDKILDDVAVLLTDNQSMNETLKT